jgi:hypothetical protein
MEGRHPMVETSCAAVLRDTYEGQRFLNALWLISAVALLFCFLSITVGWLTSSGSYLEDGGVWLYDTVIYGLVAASFGRGVLIERAAAVLLAVVLAIAGCQGSYQIWSEIVLSRPDAMRGSWIAALSFAGGASFEAALLFRYRNSGEPLMKGAWLSARNSAVIGVIGAALPLMYHASTADRAQICVDCLDTFLALQASFFVIRETLHG